MSVSIGDVKGWLSESSLDLGTLCQSSNIDANKLYKPIRNSSTTSLSNRDSDGISYTVYDSHSAMQTAVMSLASSNWLRGSYDKPRGSGYSEYYRLMDFDGYNTSACLSGDRYTRSGNLIYSSINNRYELTLSASGFDRFQNQILSTYNAYTYKHYGFLMWYSGYSYVQTYVTNRNVTTTSIASISASNNSTTMYTANTTYKFLPFIAFTNSSLPGSWGGSWTISGITNTYSGKIITLPVTYLSLTAPAQPTPPDPSNFVEIYFYSIAGHLDPWSSLVYTDTASIYVFNNSDYSLSDVSAYMQVTTNYGTYAVDSFSYSGGSTLSSHAGGYGSCSQPSSCPGSSGIATYTVTVQYKCPSLSTSWFYKTATQQVTLQQ